MGVLSDLLQYKAQREAQAQADIQAIPQAALLYEQARQNRAKTQLDQISTLGILATKGIVPIQNKSGELLGFRKEPSLVDEEDLLRKQLLQRQVSAYDQFLGNQKSGTTLDTLLPPGADPNDFITKPELRSLRGVPTVVNAPEMKQILPPKQGSQIADIRSLYQNLENNYNMLDENVKSRMSPFNLSAHRGLLGNLAVKVQSMSGDEGAKNFASFKAEVDKTFQKYRKDTTGAQAAMKELGWLAPDLPEATDPPDIFKQKTEEALARYAQGEQLLLDTYSQQGYRTGDLSKGALSKTKNVPEGSLKSSNKVGRFTIKVK